ncbi:hypothetical protein MML48_3g00015894 [Holotrichia oblita]|uniref:Uncharacterized protein n=1 Tax=Holotrichia oblita TaxID=644536 RepID=A0ACB9TFZ6_HOLOL|nr:hypothetical protein MML48_3g00015894 [Holotrichia oblita]
MWFQHDGGLPHRTEKYLRIKKIELDDKKFKTFDSSSLPPCKVELQQHLFRVRYVTKLWRNAHLRHTTSLSPVASGWTINDNKYDFVWFVGEQLPYQVADIIIQNSGDLWENVQLFKANWNTYTLATGMDKWSTNRESQKVNILLSIIGDAAKLKFNNFGLTDEDKVNCEKLLNKISDKILSKKHQLYERWLFHTCSQLTDESFESYLLRLNKIHDQCEFDKISVDNMKNVMLRDKIMFGINDQELNNKEERREEKKEERREEHKDERRGSEVKCNNKTNNELFSQEAIENKDLVRNTETVSKNDSKANNTGRSKTSKMEEKRI